MANLRSIVRETIFSEIIRVSHNDFKVLIVDERSMKVINSMVNLFEIMEEDVTLVENLNIKRRRFEFCGIYFISPTMESVLRLLDDFSISASRCDSTFIPQYPEIYVVFTGKLRDDMVELMSKDVYTDQNNSHKKNFIRKHMKSCKELLVDFLVFEDNVFHLGMDLNYKALLSDRPSENKNIREDVAILAECIMGVLSSLNEIPHIRCYGKDALSNMLCKVIRDRLGEVLSADKIEGITTVRKQALQLPQSTLLILNRSQDLVTPMLHELTYQAMINDLLHENIQEGKIYRKDGNEAVLDEKDDLWMRLRYEPINKAIGSVIEGFKQFQLENKAAIDMLNRSKTHGTDVNKKKDETEYKNTLKVMREAVSTVVPFQKTKSRFSTHINMTQACMDVFNDENLKPLLHLEQEMVRKKFSEISAKGNTKMTYNPSEGNRSLNELFPLLDNKNIKSSNKTRLILLFLLTERMNNRQVSAEDLGRITKYSSLEDHHVGCVKNIFEILSNKKDGLSHSFGTFEEISELTLKKKKSNTGLFRKFNKKKKNGSKETSPLEHQGRYAPPLKVLIKHFLLDTLCESVYPTLENSRKIETILSGPMAEYMKKASLVSLRHKKKTRQKGPRLIIFILGGITYSEIRSMHEVCKWMDETSDCPSYVKRSDIVLGSNIILTPHSFLKCLETTKSTGLIVKSKTTGKKKGSFKKQDAIITQKSPKKKNKNIFRSLLKLFKK